MKNNPLRGLFGVSSPRPEKQRVDPQPTAPTENINYEITSGMIEKLLANPYAGDGTLHPDMHQFMWMKFANYLRLQVYPEMKLRRRFFLYI